MNWMAPLPDLPPVVWFLFGSTFGVWLMVACHFFADRKEITGG